MFFELLSLNIAIYNQKKAIKHSKALREQYLDRDFMEAANSMVNVLIDQERILTYLKQEREKLRYEKKEKN